MGASEGDAGGVPVEAGVQAPAPGPGPGPAVLAAPGRLPALWERRATFFANILSLFYGNASQTEDLRRTVGSLASYGGRLLPVIDLLFRGRPNLLVLQREPARELVDYFDGELGLTLPETAVAPEGIEGRHAWEGELEGAAAELVERLREHPSTHLDGFVSDPALERLAALTGKRLTCPPEASRAGNNKLLLHQFLEGARLPVFETEIAASAAELPGCLAALAGRGYAKAVVKAQVGASGIGMKILRAEAGAAAEVPGHLFFEGACLVQGWLGPGVGGAEAVGSPSVQLFLDEGQVTLYDVTEQVLSAESVHEGNVAPPPYTEDGPEGAEIRAELLRQAGAAGTWLHRRGYRGTASADFHLVRRGGRVEVRVCEINARVTGATYPALLARHFRPGEGWLMRNLCFSPAVEPGRLLEDLRAAGLLFRPGADGVLPINLILKEGDEGEGGEGVVKGQFLFLASGLGEAARLMETAAKDVLAGCTYDRD